MGFNEICCKCLHVSCDFEFTFSVCPFNKLNMGMPFEDAIFDALLLDLAKKLESIHSEFFNLHDSGKYKDLRVEVAF